MPGKLNFIGDKVRSISDPQLDVKKLNDTSNYEPVKSVEDMSEADFRNSWFKTWPERHYDKLEQASDKSPEDEVHASGDKCENLKSPIPLNEIFEKLPLAYSPVTKQLHLLNARDEAREAAIGKVCPGRNENPDRSYCDNDDDDDDDDNGGIGGGDGGGGGGGGGDDGDDDDYYDDYEKFRARSPEDSEAGYSRGRRSEKTKNSTMMLDLSQNLGKDLVLRSCLKRLEICADEKFSFLWNSKIGYSDPRRTEISETLKIDGSALRTEASSFSSIVSSLSDASPSNCDETFSNKLACLDNDDLSIRSHYSQDSGSNCGESSKFFEEKGAAREKCDSRRKGLSGFFSRSVFSWRGTSSTSQGGWRLFGKAAAQESRDGDSLNFTNSEVLWAAERSLTDSPVSGKRYEDVVASSTALILHNRPASLPAKSIDEEQKHKLEYQQIVEAARKKEVKETKLRKKQLQQQLKVEEQLANASRIWNKEILPKWDLMRNSRKARELWWAGIPPCVRGRVWKLAIGNELNITNQLYEICLARAQERLKAVENNEAKETANNADKESSVELIQLDISRTFPHLCIFQKGGPYHDILHCLIGAYVCYRPDVGYVQGMSFIAAILILNLEAPDAFISFSNLLNRPCHMTFFSLNQPLMQAYYDTYNDFFRENLPRLCQHFQESSLTTDLYLLDWVYSVFAKAMPLDVTCRVWDVYLRDGEEFLFRTALGILHLHKEKLMKLDFINASQFLTKLPEDLSPDLLFKSIEAIKMNVGKQKFSQVLSGHIERHSAR